MCIDYGALNTLTEKSGYPLLKIQKDLDTQDILVYLAKIDFILKY